MPRVDTGVLEHGVYTLEAAVSSLEWQGLGRRELVLKAPSRGRGQYANTLLVLTGTRGPFTGNYCNHMLIIILVVFCLAFSPPTGRT